MSRCIITCHGYTGYPEEMAPMGEYFEHRGYSWVNLTLPGHDSTPEDLMKTTRFDWMDYVDKQVTDLTDQYEHVFFSGLSLGGAMTLYALEKHQSLTGGIALAPPWEILNFWQKILVSLPLPGFWIERGEEEIVDVRNKNAAQLHRAYTRHHTDSVKELHSLIRDVRSRLGDITAPTMIVYSKSDRVLPFHKSLNLVKAIGADQVEFLVVNSSGHVLTRDYDASLIFNKAYQFTESLI